MALAPPAATVPLSNDDLPRRRRWPAARRRLLVSLGLVVTVVWLATAQKPGPQLSGTLYLHTDASGATDFLDATAPATTAVRFKESQVSRPGFQTLGIWTSGAAARRTEIATLSDFVGWFGVGAAQDRGAFFDVRVELVKNAAVIASGEVAAISGLQPPGGPIKDLAIPFRDLSDRTLERGDVLSLRVLARTSSFGRPSAGPRLRLYYDALNHASGIRARLVTTNTPPVANAGPDQTVALGQTVTLDGSGSTDADGDSLTFTWTMMSRPDGSGAALSNATEVTPTFQADRSGSYNVRLIVYDGTTNSAADIVIVSTLNSSPVANAGLDRTATVGSTVTLDASGSSDVDGDPLTYEWSFLSRPPGSAAVLQNATSVTSTFVVDSPGSYVVELVVNDGIVDSDPATVTISTENSPPVARAGPNQTARVGDVVTLDGSASNDIDGDPLTYRWSFITKPDASSAVLDDSFSVAPTFSIDAVGNYVIQLIVNDGTVDSPPSTLTVSTINTSPLAHAGPDQRVPVGTSVQLDGSGSTDVDGDPLFFTWSLVAKPDGSAATLSSLSTVNPTFEIDASGTYVVQLIVSDGFINSAPDTVAISTENRAPIAEAGPNQSVLPGSIVQLDGNGSSDPDGDQLTFTWSVLSKPPGSTAALSDAAIPNPTFEVDQPGTYVVQLSVNDGEFNATPDVVTITTNNAAPIADAGSDQTVAAGSSVQLDSAASSDPDGSSLSYSWSLTTIPPGSSAVLSDPAAADPSFVADTRGVYVAQLIVGDGLLFSQPDTVTITATNRLPIALDDSATTSMNAPVVVNVLANDSDPDGDALAVSSLTQPTHGTAATNADNTITYTPDPSFVGSDSFTYEISDQEATASATVRITVNAVAVCPAPVITSLEPLAGPVGAEVTITGVNLDCGNTRRLALNGTELLITSLGPTELTTFIPIGSQGGVFTLTTDGGTVTARQFAYNVTRSQEFALDVLPPSASVIQGSFTTYFVHLSEGTAPFTGLAALSVSDVPPGASASFSPAFVTAGQHSTLTLTVDGTTPIGTTTFEIHASATIDAAPATLSKSAQINVLPSGITALAGRVLDTETNPIPGVTLRVGGLQSAITAVTDAGGNFLMLDPPLGDQLLLIDGQTASDEITKYPTIPHNITIVEGIVNRLPFQPFLHAQKNVNFTAINPVGETIVTDPDLPGVVLRIPAGVQIIGWDGQPNTRVSMRAVPVDRLPIPPPPVQGLTGTVYMFYFGKVGGGTPTEPIPFSVPNDAGLEPGEQAELWYFDESPIPGEAPNDWRLAGLGTVSADGTTLTTDPGVGIPRFCCGAAVWGIRLAKRYDQLAGATSQLQQAVFGGDPVDLSTGVFMFSVSDLVVPGRIPLVIERTYRSGDAVIGGFGRGTWMSYNDVLAQTAPDVLTYVYRGRARTPFFRQFDGSYATGTVPAFRGTRITIDPLTGARVMRHRDGTVFEFDATGLMVAIRDANANQISIGRTGGLQSDRITDPAGRLVSVTKSFDRVTSVTDPAGRMVRYEYDGAARLTRVIQADGSVTQYGYDSLHRMTSITDGRGVTYLRNTYDVNSRVCQQEQADGGKYTFYYVTGDRLGMPDANVVPEIANTGRTTMPPCSAPPTTGNVVATVLVDPMERATTYRFDASGWLTSVIDTLGRATEITREYYSKQLWSIRDSLGRTTYFRHDGLGNLKTLVDPALNIREFEYERAFSRLTKATDPLGNVTTLEYDGRGNLTAITDPEQNLKPEAQRLKTTIARDAFGQASSITDVLGGVTTFTYDANGSMTAISDPLGHTVARSYDAISRPVKQIDARGRATTLRYDGLSRIVQIDDALQGTTGLTYDANGNVIAVRDARGNTVTLSYDVMDHLVARADALGRAETFTYDLNGNRIQSTNRKSQTTSYEYDSVNRRTRAVYADGSSVQFTFDAADRLVHVNDAVGGEILNRYDTLDRLIATTSDVGVVQYTYDKLGRRTTTIASGIGTVAYGYDANSRLRQVTNAGQSVTLTYDALNRRSSLTLPNGVSTEYRYDAASRVNELAYRNSSGTIGNLTYQYDAAGNRRGVGGSLARTLLPDAVASASYDSANRQLQFGSRAMTYDLAGNVTSIAEGAGVTSLTWDARERLANLTTPGTQAAFSYDAFGRRHAKQINGTLTRTLHDGLTPVLDLSGTPQTYLTGRGIDEPWARNNAEFYLADAIGSILGITDAAGALTTQYIYDPFGRGQVEGSSPSSNAFQFTARENDGTGLYNYRARYYSPDTGRFVSEDPIGLLAGDTNYYAYVGNRPTRFVDPLGLERSTGDRARTAASSLWDIGTGLSALRGDAILDAADIAKDLGYHALGGLYWLDARAGEFNEGILNGLYSLDTQAGKFNQATYEVLFEPNPLSAAINPYLQIGAGTVFLGAGFYVVAPYALGTTAITFTSSQFMAINFVSIEFRGLVNITQGIGNLR